MQDITDSKRVELALIEAKETAENAMSIKSRFLDIAAHELRTPVSAFSLLLQFTQMQLEKGHPVDMDTLVRLRAQANRISQLVVDLLDVSRLERGALNLRRESSNLVSIISECVNEFELRAPTRRITFYKPEQNIEINIDRVRIYQVISNLLDNIIKYTPDKSPVEVVIDMKPELIRVSVKDHGPGIAEREQMALFNPFGRGTGGQEEQVAGLGLGLYICRGIIELHGGTIGVKSKLGVGSTFFFDLPRDIASRRAA